jgi:hypothetical protein
VPDDPVDDAREHARADSDAHGREARAEERAVDAAAHAEHEQARREQLIAESPPHLRGLIT